MVKFFLLLSIYMKSLDGLEIHDDMVFSKSFDTYSECKAYISANGEALARERVNSLGIYTFKMVIMECDQRKVLTYDFR